MIKISDLHKRYNDLEVLKGINLEIQKGQFFGIIGKSGSGKSTLLRCINGTEKYDKGSLMVDGVEINKLSDKELRTVKKSIGMIFQLFSLLTRLNVYENIALPMRCWKYNNNAIDKKVMELLEVVGLLDKSKSFPKELSGGQKQRVAIARALAMSPQILLCDESTSSLDPVVAKSIIELLAKINRELKVTIIMVTHQMSVLKASCEEIAIIEDGIIAEKGDLERIFLKHPESLENLMGRQEYLHDSNDVLIKILFNDYHYNILLISEIAQNLNIKFSVLEVKTENFNKNIWGSILLKIRITDLVKITCYLNDNQIKFEIIN